MMFMWNNNNGLHTHYLSSKINNQSIYTDNKFMQFQLVFYSYRYAFNIVCTFLIARHNFKALNIFFASKKLKILQIYKATMHNLI